MTYLIQFLRIIAVTAAGEVLHAVIPLPVPGSVYGLVLMLLCLMTGIIKLPQVEKTASFLIAIMPLMFIPATAGLMNSFDAMKQMLIPLLAISVSTTFVVMAVSGKVTDLIMERKKRGEDATDETEEAP